MPDSPDPYTLALTRHLSRRARARLVQVGSADALVTDRLHRLAMAFSTTSRIMIVESDAVKATHLEQAFVAHPRMSTARVPVGGAGPTLAGILTRAGWSPDGIDLLQVNVTEEPDTTLGRCDLEHTRPQIIAYRHRALAEIRRLALEARLHRLGYHLQPWTLTDTFASRQP